MRDVDVFRRSVAVGRTVAEVAGRVEVAAVKSHSSRCTISSPAVRQAGLEGLKIHGLRHTAAGLMIEQGHQPRTIMDRMGHSSITVTMVVGEQPGDTP